MELLIYGAALGVSAAYIVPILAKIFVGFLPASIQTNFTVPTATPATLTAGFWAILFWGVLLGASLWAVSLIRPVGEAVRESA